MTSIIKVDTVQDVDGNNIISENANTITIGASGDTISIPAGATLVNSGTATGFGLTWQSVQTTGFTAVKGNAYPCNTTSAGFTVTLPATPSAGDQVQLVDYAGTFDTNALTINPNGNKLESGTDNLRLSGEREGVILTYIDSTQGWIATSGINEGTDALEPTTALIDFLVIAGGGAGGSAQGGGGGAGGYRTSAGTSGGGGSAESSLTVNFGTNYTVTVGGGGAGVLATAGTSGSNSVFSSITSTGGGGGGSSQTTVDGGTGNGRGGGSGGGGSSDHPSTGGAGTANQGFAGGNGIVGSSGNRPSGGGGGSGSVGVNAAPSVAGNGGAGTASSITGSSVTYAGGGGGGGSAPTKGTGQAGGSNGTDGSSSGNATVNTGSGSGGNNASFIPGNGGSGVVILKYPDTLTISNPGGGLTFTTSTSGGYDITSFTAGTGNVQFN